MDKEKVFKNLKSLLEQREEINFAYVFGSFPYSDNFHDIDIAIHLNKDFDFKDTNRFPFGYESALFAEISNTLKTDKLDIVVMNKAGLLILHRIINKSILLFERDKYQRISYENFIRKNYIDAEPLRKIQSKYLSKKL